MKPRVAEVRAITPLLEQEWDDSEALACAVIEALGVARLEARYHYLVPYQRNIPAYHAWGPFSTRGQVDKAAQRWGLGPGEYVTVETRPYADLKDVR